jgi:hypothetical protein
MYFRVGGTYDVFGQVLFGFKIWRSAMFVRSAPSTLRPKITEIARDSFTA